MCVLETPGAVARITTPLRRLDAQDAEQVEIVLEHRHTGGRAVPDHGLKVGDFALPFGTLSEHDGAVLRAVDVGGLEERRRYAVEGDAVLFDQFAEALQLIGGGVEFAFGRLRISADALDAVAGEVAEMLLVGRRALTTEFHARGFSSGSVGAASRDGGGGRTRMRQ